ncbi:MAG: dihydroxyacetone kinase subunit DhaK [Muricomes sp.]|uniref:dihydroxyacetone kinase subunit DhaK n=1 Tax=Faecalicatena contorta TaxID=39482 RepID=UPI002EC0F43A|nr:dihydroxyacetone kinase subunit DhaK [Muricomes sp.]
MKKIMNEAENYVDDMLEGIYSAHPEELTYVNEDIHCLISKKNNKNKVAIVTGGGSGHLPLFLGYVGRGMLDGCAVGHVFQSPPAEQMAEVTKAVDNGKGVLYILGNYNGDKFNFQMAGDTVAFENDIQTEMVIAGDDIAVAAEPDGSMPGKRRGVAGIFFLYKCAGAAAEMGLDLKGVTQVALKVRENVRTIGIALSACIIPRVGKPGFEIEEDSVEIGMGIHGETGIRVEKLKTADEIVNEMMDMLFHDMPVEADGEVAVLLNGMGSTPLDELYIMLKSISKYLKDRGVKLYRSYVGEYATSMEMAGASISIFKLNDELKQYLDAPADTPFFKQI